MPQVHELATVPRDNEIVRVPILVARALYDFAVDGGAVSTINLMPSAALPSGALVLAAFLNVITVPTSGGAATISVETEAAGDLQSAAAISGAPWSSTGWKAATKTFATAPIKLTAARNIRMTIGTAALTAGKFEVIVFYLPPGL